MMKKNIWRRGGAWLLALALAFSLAAPAWAAEGDPDAPGGDTDNVTLTLSATEMTVVQGKKEAADEITATVTPESEKDNVEWTVTDETIVSLNAFKGEKVEVTGLAKGKTTVTAKIGDVEAQCEITVLVPLTEVSFEIGRAHV